MLWIKIILYIENRKTRWHLLMKYLFEIEHAELLDKSDKIQFLYNARQINFGDKTNVREYFHNENNPVILVMDINNLLSNNSLARQNVVFFDSSKKKRKNIVVNIGTSIEQFIKMYLYKVGGLELIDDYYSKKNICFLYNSQDIAKCGEKIVEKFISPNAEIRVHHLKNL